MRMSILSLHKGEVGWAGREGWSSDFSFSPPEAPMMEGEFEMVSFAPSQTPSVNTIYSVISAGKNS